MSLAQPNSFRNGPDERGHFGLFGGRFVAETLMPLILELDLTDGVPEAPPADPLSAVLSLRKLRLQDVIDGLRRARHDDRVRVLVAKVGGGHVGAHRHLGGGRGGRRRDLVPVVGADRAPVDLGYSPPLAAPRGIETRPGASYNLGGSRRGAGSSTLVSGPSAGSCLAGARGFAYATTIPT